MKEEEESFPIPDKSKSDEAIYRKPKQLTQNYYANRDHKSRKYPNYASELKSTFDSVLQQS